MLKTVGTYILLVFGFVANAASIAGFWLSYASASADTQVRFGRILLLCGSLGAGVAYLCVAALLFIRLRAPVPVEKEVLGVAPLTPLPDLELKSHDPRIEIVFTDSRGAVVNPKDAFDFTLVNRGGSDARFASLESLALKGHKISFPKFGERIAPYKKADFYPAIRTPDGKSTERTILNVLYEEYQSFHAVNMHELSWPMRATYQDDISNLYETRCELVFNPIEYLKSMPNNHPVGLPVTIRNLVYRKAAISASLLRRE